MAHRALWTFVTVLIFLKLRGQFTSFVQALRNPERLRSHSIGGFLLMGNWGLYIWGVGTNRIIETSLGYFLVPLLNAGLGGILFHERLRRAQKIALGLATAGVLLRIWQVGSLPWIALGVAVTWSVYGLVRKKSSASPLVGLALETGFISPFALGFIIWLYLQGSHHFGVSGLRPTLLIMGTGAISMVPLTLFALGARRLRFTTLGLLQYVAPTCQFLIGWLIYHEHLSAPQVGAFLVIWLGLAIYTFDAIRHDPLSARPATPPEASAS